VFDATQALWETNDDGTPVAAVPGASAPAPGQASAPAPAATPVVESGEDDSHDDDAFDLGPEAPPLPAGIEMPAMSWPKADLLDLGGGSAAIPAPTAPRWTSEPVSVAYSEAAQRFGDAAHEPRFDALPSLDLGLPADRDSAPAQRREPEFSPVLTGPSAAVSPIEEAVNAQLQKALRRERVKALRRERSEQRERERHGHASSAGDPSFDASPVADGAASVDLHAADVGGSPSSAPSSAERPALRLPSESASHADATHVAAPAAAPLPSFADVSADQDARPRRRAGNWLWALACLCALAVLALQYLRHERDILVARQPQLRPVLQALCDWTHCRLAAPRMIAAISIEGASLSSDRNEGYRLDFTLRNGARMPLAMPAVELTLLDTQERALVRRVLQPNEFGAPGVLAAGAERNASLPVRLSGPDAAGLPPVAGYRLSAFYP